MKTKVNPTLLGAFLLLGVALFLASLVVLGAGRLFRQPIDFVMVFPESVNGLSEGAPVKFKGVPIGQVRRLLIGVDSANKPVNVQIYGQINPSQLLDRAGRARQGPDAFPIVLLVKRGLRATVELESFVTGQLYVSLDMISDADPPVFLLPDAECPEIPVQTAGLKEFLRSLEQLNVPSLATKADSILGRLSEILEQVEMDRLNQEIIETFAAVNSLLRDPATVRLVASASGAADEARALAVELRERLGPLGDHLTQTSERATITLAELEALASGLRQLTAPDSATVLDLQAALRDLSRAVHSFRLLADSLNRNPNALLTGRRPSTP